MGSDQKRLREKGRTIIFADAWIATAALQLNVPLATHNAREFESVDRLRILTAVRNISPYTAESGAADIEARIWLGCYIQASATRGFPV